jgi:hypothetical protein
VKGVREELVHTVVPCNTTALRIIYQDCHVGRWLCGFIIAVKVVTILWMIR